MPPLDHVLPSETPWWVYLIVFIIFGGSGAKMVNGVHNIYKGHAEAERQQIKEAVSGKDAIIAQLQADVASIRVELKEMQEKLKAAETKESDTARKLRILEEAHAGLRRIFIEKVGCEEQLPPWPKY